MVQLDAGIIGPDGLGGAYKNTASVLEALSWYALGGKQGVLSGMTLAGVAGSMAIDVAAGAAMISRRDGSNNVQAMGYLVPVPVTTRVTFGPASPAARNDALVAAVVDTTDGPVGTGGLASGGHLVAVPGVSGTSTPRTDADIAAFLGRGGFVRLADVPIASTDTQITMANVTDKRVLFSAWQTLPTSSLTGGTGWTVTSIRYRLPPQGVYLEVGLSYTGSTVTTDGVGNFGADITMATGLDSSIRPSEDRLVDVERSNVATFRGKVSSAGVLILSHTGIPGYALVSGHNLLLSSFYLI